MSEFAEFLQTVLTDGRIVLTAPPDDVADAFAVTRFHAVQLVASLKAAGAKPGLSLETRAHIAESADLLDAMLRASVTKS